MLRLCDCDEPDATPPAQPCAAQPMQQQPLLAVQMCCADGWGAQAERRLWPSVWLAFMPILLMALARIGPGAAPSTRRSSERIVSWLIAK